MSDDIPPMAADGAAADAGPAAGLAAGAVLFAVSLLGWWTVRRNPELVGADYGVDPGPGLLPQITLSLLSLFALALAGQGAVGLLRRRRGGGARPGPRGAWTLRRLSLPALLVATMTCYALLFPRIGFVWATIGFALFWTVVLGAVEFPPLTPRRAALYAIEAGGITVLVWAAFAVLIGVPLP